MNSLSITRWVCKGFELCVVLCISPVIFAQPDSVEIGLARREVGNVEVTQESKMDDSFLVKNNDHFSICAKSSDGAESEMIACLSESVEKLDGYLSRLIFRKKLDVKVREQFFESRKNLCLKVTDDFDGANKSIVYADCLRLQTMAEIIKKSHSLENIDEFLLLLFTQEKISFREREIFFSNRKSFCTNAKNFQSNFLENFSKTEYVYQNCLATQAIEEVLKRLH